MAEDPKEVLRRSRALLQAERASKEREELLEKLPQHACMWGWRIWFRLRRHD